MIRLTIGALSLALMFGNRESGIGNRNRNDSEPPMPRGPMGVLVPIPDSRFPIPDVVGPPWISIEYPVNPYDSSTRDAFLLVHAFHHGTPVEFPVSGTAEGLVRGQRRSTSLQFTRTSRPGVYALRKQWANDGVWTLLIAVRQGEGKSATAQAVVELGADGQVAAVRVPTRREREWLLPETVSLTEVEAGLRARAK